MHARVQDILNYASTKSRNDVSAWPMGHLQARQTDAVHDPAARAHALGLQAKQSRLKPVNLSTPSSINDCLCRLCMMMMIGSMWLATCMHAWSLW